MAKAQIWIDGGCRGQHDKTVPNQCFVALVIEADGKEIYSYTEKTDVNTSNEAEWQALIEALKKVKLLENKYKKFEIFMDSKLVLMQFQNKWRINPAGKGGNPNFKIFYREAWNIYNTISSNILFKYTRRNYNKAGWLLE